MADLWNTRHEAESALNGPLELEARVVNFGFRLIDRCAALLSQQHTPFNWVCLGVLIKARNLVLGCYSLVLDGLAQEGGALLRPLIETSELLVYFSQDTSRVNRVIDGQKLPTAGQIARKIGGELQELREYLNDHASHFSFTNESIRHLWSATNGWQLVQPYNESVVRTNLKMIWAVQAMVLTSAYRCVMASQTLETELMDLMREWTELSVKTFDIEYKGKHLSDTTRVP